MTPLFRKLIFLWVGNISMWMYYGGQKKMEDIAKKDNQIIGVKMSVILGFLIYFSLK